MRITIVGPTAPLRGGVVAHTEGARDALERRGHSVDVVGVERVFPRWLARARAARARPVTRGAIDALAPRTWSAAAAISTDLLIVQHWTPVLAPALAVVLTRTRAQRRVVVCHNVDPHERIPGARAMTSAVLARANRVIFHSEHVREVARARCGLARDRAATAPMPLLMRAGIEGRAPSELQGYDDGAPLVVLVGHLRGYKGLKDLLRAWPSVAAVVPGRLVVAGEPLGVARDMRRVARLAARGHRVTTISRYLEDAELSWLLANADAVVLPYVTASQSAVLPLAMRLSRHVVVSDAGALPEQAGAATDRVTLVPAADVSSLASAIAQALTETVGRELRATRQPGSSVLSPSELSASWVPFVKAVEGAAAGSGLPSNSDGGGPSLLRKSANDEPSRGPWYHARRFAPPGSEAPDE